MTSETAPNVLVIDDTDELTFVNELISAGLQAKYLHPNEVEKTDVLQADVVLIDYQLDDWPDRAGSTFSLQPRDGLALSSVLRRQVHDEQRRSPTAFAIRTGFMDALASPLPPESRHHMLAQLNNLEWVFEKSSDTATVNQIKSLATTLRQLPINWPIDTTCDSQEIACRLLNLDQDNNPEAEADVRRCLPPLHSMSSWSHGLAFVRWMLHRILPYPCFLLDEHYLAARLRISLQGLQDILVSPADPLKECEYHGVLGDFLGRRWWRAEIEQLLWRSTSIETLEGETIREWLTIATGVQPEPASTDDYPVVCRDIDHRAIPKAYPMSECVRIQPDDWPAYADQAWTTIDLASTQPALGCLVKPEDNHKLHRNGP
jgi:hypothetical protein